MLSVLAAVVLSHNVYLANDNHTDYGWNASVAQYEQAMLADLDFYVARVAATSGAPGREQARFMADCWYWVWLYEQNRTPQQFQALLAAMRSGHITAPLNPFVLMYGTLPTEAAIRSGYYAGRLERLHGVSFALGQYLENATIPWGVASLWAGSRAKYSWKGICGCASSAPSSQHTTDVFRWEGPDGAQLLVKWYQFSGDNAGSGGYAEARNNLSQAAVQSAITRQAMRGQSLTGLFGLGWDDVSQQSTAIETLAQQWNAAHTTDKVTVSNGVDYFTELEQGAAALPVLRGGWGNEWDLQVATLAERTAQTRRALERLRTAEAMAAYVTALDPTFWTPRQRDLEAGFLDLWKYHEHTWVNAGSVTIAQVTANKKAWAQGFVSAVTTLDGLAQQRFAALFATPDEDRVVVFNPLGFARTDVVDVAVPAARVVTDVETGQAVPAQLRAGGATLRFLASNVPPLGFRVYRLTAGTPAMGTAAASLTGSSFESSRYRLTFGARGDLTSLVDKANGNRELAGAGLNDFGSGTGQAPSVVESGPVSTTVRVSVTGTPPRTVEVTLFAAPVERVELLDAITANYTALGTYRFAPLMTPALRFEEVGGIARPGLVANGGDFQPGTRADYMTLNHFVEFTEGNASVVLSALDAAAWQAGASTPAAFDLTSRSARVLVTGNVAQGGIFDQGGDTRFTTTFALVSRPGGASGAASMGAALQHQDPLRAVVLPRNQAGPITATSAGGVVVSPSNVHVFAFKPAEDANAGLVLRLWELDGVQTNVSVDLSAFAPSSARTLSLIETDTGAATLSNGVLTATLKGQELRTFRFVPTRIPGLGADGGVDAGVLDAGLADAGLSDAGTGADAGVFDAGADDAGTTDAGLADAGGDDAGAIDAGGDAGDGGVADGGGSTDVAGGCGCQAGNDVLALGMLTLLLARRRRS